MLFFKFSTRCGTFHCDRVTLRFYCDLLFLLFYSASSKFNLIVSMSPLVTHLGIARLLTQYWVYVAGLVRLKPWNTIFFSPTPWCRSLQKVKLNWWLDMYVLYWLTAILVHCCVTLCVLTAVIMSRSCLGICKHIKFMNFEIGVSVSMSMSMSRLNSSKLANHDPDKETCWCCVTLSMPVIVWDFFFTRIFTYCQYVQLVTKCDMQSSQKL